MFASEVKSEVLSLTAAQPDLAGQGPKIANAVQSGGVSQLIAHIPASSRAAVHHITTTAFTGGLNKILLVAAIIALAAALTALTTIRQKDFAHQPS